MQFLKILLKYSILLPARLQNKGLSFLFFLKGKISNYLKFSRQASTQLNLFTSYTQNVGKIIEIRKPLLLSDTIKPNTNGQHIKITSCHQQ